MREKQIQPKKIHYETTDLNLAAYLKSQGVKFINVRYGEKFATFIFEDIPKTKEMVQAFYKDTKINSFIHAFKEIKALLFNQK